MNRSKEILVAAVVATLLIGFGGGASAAELDGPVSVVYDSFGVPTIIATTEHDAVYMQGYLHAKDRLFQMDFLRHVFQGRVAELVGPAGLPQDVQLRVLGIQRAAQRTLPVQTPEVLAWLQAYADGVNAYISDPSNPIPIEYSALEIDRSGIEPWTPLDGITMVKGLAFELSFDLSDIDRTLALLTFRAVCEILGCNGLQLSTVDLYPTAPFEGVVSTPPNPPPPLAPGEEPPSGEPPADEQPPAFMSDPNFQTLTQNYRDAIADIPILQDALENDLTSQGSNWWIVSGALTESGFPMIANDPHLSLGSPATFYEVHLNVTGGINVTGVSFPGAPGIVQGCNDEICWGSTVNAQDVTDVYQEVLIATNPAAPTSPTHTFWGGGIEPIQFIPQQFNFNVIGDGVPNNVFNAGLPPASGGVTMVVPRRLNGPIVQVIYDPSSPTPLTAISVQYAGWEPTHELEAFRRMARAGSMADFKDALQYFDVGSQNWSYADIHGNIAYYTSGEVPIREDLQQLFFPAGLQPPGLIRDGTHTNPHEWMPLTNPQPNQALSTEILPFAEMPQVENPAAGYVVNANNDPIGTTFDNVAWNEFRAGFNGRLYLSSQYATGYRQGRLQRLLDALFAGGGKMSTAESIATQANNQLLDAEILSPYLLDAYANATAVGAPPELTAIVSDPRIGEAISRLSAWDFSTPTGINQGFDPGDNPAAPGPPSAAEVDASVAATIYAMWRGQTVQRVIDGTLANLPIPLVDYAPGSAQAMTALRRLLDNYSVNGGTGVSLINFFTVPGVADQDVARDIILLQSLANALDLLASDEFAPAFNNSTNLADYRWGYLHRIVFSHYLGGPFNIPPPGSPLNVAPDLPGLSRAGGMGAVDASSHSARADGLNEFMFGSGPSRRLIATMEPTGPQVLEVIPGGQSGQPGNPMGIDQLFLWLVNAFKPLPVSLADVNALAAQTDTYACGDGVVGPGEQCDDGNADDADGCNQACVVVPAITCLSPVAVADAQTCDASIACGAVASCVDPLGGSVTSSCAPAGPYGIGTTAVTVQCVGAETSARVCSATVADQTSPTIAVTLDPDSLWPPNHRMVDVLADVQAGDTCSTATVTLDSVTSNEPDNGDNDGNTINDIQGVDAGTADFAFQLRAERQGAGGDGRTYTVTYTATDGAGNATSGSATVVVEKDRDGVTEPVMMLMGKKPAGSYATWTEADVGVSYTLVRGDLAELSEQANDFELKELTCLDIGIMDTQSTFEDPVVPEVGGVFYYLVEYDEGGMRSSFGTVSAEKPRHPQGTYCE
jgi:penicillin amidase